MSLERIFPENIYRSYPWIQLIYLCDSIKIIVILGVMRKTTESLVVQQEGNIEATTVSVAIITALQDNIA